MSTTFRIVSGGGIGEALLLTPALRALKEENPSSKTYVYCLTRHHFEVFKNNRNIDRLSLRLRRSFWKHPYWVIREFLFAPKNYIRPFYGRLLPNLVYQKHASRIVSDMVGVSPTSEKLDLFLTQEEEEEGRNLISRYSSPVIIHTIASFTKNKNWIHEYWAELIERNPSYSFIQIGTKSEPQIEGSIDGREGSLRVQFSMIKAAKAFVGVDSVFAHAASALEAPAVVLFGPSPPSVFGNKGSVNLYEGLRCSPCIEVLRADPCPYGTRCMADITVDKVEAALRAVMSKDQADMPANLSEKLVNPASHRFAETL